jgi:hypothetical protein
VPGALGRFSRAAFGVVPEGEVKVGYRFANFLSAFVGYDFLFWNDVVRPGDQLDLRVDPTRVPSDPAYNPSAPRATLPAVPFKSSSFWAQGIAVGLEFRY